MKTVLPVLLLLLVYGSALAPLPAEAAAVPAGDFAKFWDDFRSAVLQGRAAQTAALTHFPFKTRGTMDDDPVVAHDRPWFLRSYKNLLAVDPGLSDGPWTMRKLIEQTTGAVANDAVSGNRARIGDFLFEKINGRWWFTFAYFDENE